MKKVTYSLLIIIMIFSHFAFFSVADASVDLATFNSKLSAFRTEKYAHGSTYQDNPELTGGYTCFGFANEVALYIWGSYPTKSMSAASVNSGWNVTYGGSAVDNLCVGDIVRYHYHSIFITGISGDTIYYCQANTPSGTNKVTFDNTVSRSSLKSKVSDQLTSPGTTKTGWVAHYTGGLSPSNPPDTEAPTISNVRVRDISSDSFTIKCDLDDNVGVTSVKIVLYAPGGEYRFSRSASNGTCAFTIETKDYGGAGTYSAHVYALDGAGNTSAYARTGDIYAISTYTITYDANGGTGAPNQQIKQYGETITLSTVWPSRPGFDFCGWATSPNATTATYPSGGMYSANSSITLYAFWKPKSYTTITYDANGGTGAPSPQIKPHGETVQLSNNGKFVTISSTSYSQGEINTTLSGDIDEIKVMVWDSLASMKPLCTAEVIPSSEFITE